MVIEDISPLEGKTVLDINSYASSRFNIPALADISEKIGLKLKYRDFIQELLNSKINYKYFNAISQTLENSHVQTSFSDQCKIVIDPSDLYGISMGHICSAIFMHLNENDAGDVYVQGKIRIRIPGLLDSIPFSMLILNRLDNTQLSYDQATDCILFSLSRNDSGFNVHKVLMSISMLMTVVSICKHLKDNNSICKSR